MARLAKSEQTLVRARRLRAEQTNYEKMLWRLLRDRRLRGVKVRRQAPLGDYVVDFVCLNAKLVIELDGPEHELVERKAFDNARTGYLNAAGFRVLRIRNGDLAENSEGVLVTIIQALRTQ